jgi:hypothetical protein
MDEDFQCEFDDSAILDELKRLSNRVSNIELAVGKMAKILNELARINHLQV